MNKATKFITVLAATLLLVSAFGCTGGGKVKTWSTPPAMQIDVTKKYTAVFDTALGSFEIELLAAESPNTVNNFVFLARQGFYNGTVFHRILKDFVIQGGDPGNGNGGLGTGDPGYKFDDELPVKHSYTEGIIAMANSGENSNGSQFFICVGYRAVSLDSTPNFTQFGRVSSGMDIVLKLASVPVVYTYINGQLELSKPVNPPKINKITIVES